MCFIFISKLYLKSCQNEYTVCTGADPKEKRVIQKSCMSQRGAKKDNRAKPWGLDLYAYLLAIT